MYKLSLIIPCFNEAASLPKLIARCEEVFCDKSVEVILVDNGSEDDTSKVISDHIKKNYIRSVRVEENKGYGYGILYGLKYSTADFLAWTHADLQTDVSDILLALDILEKQKYNKELFIKGRRSGRPLSDSFFTFGMSVFESIFLRKIMFDINAQPTVLSRVFFESWIRPPLDFSLDLYAYYMAKKENLIVKRIPVVFLNREFGHSHWNVDWKSKIKFIKRTLKYSTNLKKEVRDANL